ncbi:MAG: hypothetical protein ACRD1P_03900, partial [Thermoanaerobaculia bacterium]
VPEEAGLLDVAVAVDVEILDPDGVRVAGGVRGIRRPLPIDVLVLALAGGWGALALSRTEAGTWTLTGLCAATQ